MKVVEKTIMWSFLICAFTFMAIALIWASPLLLFGFLMEWGSTDPKLTYKERWEQLKDKPTRAPEYERFL